MESYLPFIMVVASAVALSGAVEYRKPFNSIKATREIIKNYEVVMPIITTKDSQLSYTKILEVTVPTQYDNYSLVLHMNENVMSGDFTSMYFDQEGRMVKDESPYPNCYYHGTVKGHPDWIATMTTCQGLQGEFGEWGNKENYYHLEPLDKDNPLMDQLHAFYKDSEYKIRRGRCGTTKHHIMKDHAVIPETEDIPDRHHARARRQTSIRYVELVVINDDAQYTAFNRSITATVQRAISVSNAMDPFYRKLTPVFRIVLTGSITFINGNKFQVLSDSNILLDNLQAYVRVNLTSQHRDTIMLLTGIQLAEDVLGVALLGTMCSLESSIGLSSDGGLPLASIVATATHELGHVLNMNHDADSCACPDEQGCIMAAFENPSPPVTFSNCSQLNVNELISRNGDSCLFNSPSTTVESPICGNGIRQGTESCDCGSVEVCSDPCCNATTCQLVSGARCSASQCCDSMCQFSPSTTQCRAKSGECDIAERCTGASSDCPDNVYVVDGTACKSETGYCKEGKCPTRTAQCMAAWNTTEGSMDCFDINTYGNASGNCGHTSSAFVPCQSSNVLCGQLQCSNGVFQNIYNYGSDATLEYISINGYTEECSSFSVPFTADQPNPGLVVPGTKCGNGMVCSSQQCVLLSTLNLPTCPVGSNGMTCSGNSSGICNNLGNCSCLSGFPGSTCEQPGTTTTTGSDMTTITMSETVQENTIVVGLINETPETFTVEKQTKFKIILAEAITSSCSANGANTPCESVPLSKRATVTADDIIITNIVAAPSGNGIEFLVFVRLSGNAVLPQQQLLAALTASSSALQAAGFQATFRVLVAMATAPLLNLTQLLVIIIVAVVVAAVLFIVVGLVCCYYFKTRKRNTVLYSSDLIKNDPKKPKEPRGGEDSLTLMNTQSKDDAPTWLDFSETNMYDTSDPVPIATAPGKQ